MIPLSPSSVDQNIPLPPPHLRYKVAGTEHEEWFTKSGRMSVDDLTRSLAAIGLSFDEFNDVLEWGCGCGRILRHLPPLAAPKRLYGFDIDQEALSWVNEYLPWVETSRTDGLPPLPYTDGTFDLIFNHSVMTHLDAAYQDVWLGELRRALKPGGIATLTVSGKNAFGMFLDTLPSDARVTYAENLRTDGIVYISQDQWSSAYPDFYHTSFHDVNYIFDHWVEFLDIRCYIPRGSLDYQDMIVLQKPRVDTPLPIVHPKKLLHPRDALKHVATLEADVARLRTIEENSRNLVNALDRVTAERDVALREAGEWKGKTAALFASWSWRVTAPLRRIADALRGRRTR